MRSRPKVETSIEQWRPGRPIAVDDRGESHSAGDELAIIREQLRMADDLHEMLGHALEAVAFKSELAIRLLEVDAARAHSQMEEVQRVARESMSEAGAMIRDVCSSDLLAELAGARIVFDSVGIALVVRSDAITFDLEARIVLGRALQEALTNVLRHAQPHVCRIEMDVRKGCAHLRVVNDGAPAVNGVQRGAGLTALSRYLAQHAGRVDAGPWRDDIYRLDAQVPEAPR
jgi:two-component system, NarL family, sensor histidine kinase DesK